MTLFITVDLTSVKERVPHFLTAGVCVLDAVTMCEISLVSIRALKPAAALTSSVTAVPHVWGRTNKLLKDWQPSVLPDGKSTNMFKVWRDYCNVTDDLKCPVINNFLSHLNCCWLNPTMRTFHIKYLSLAWFWRLSNFIAEKMEVYVLLSLLTLRWRRCGEFQEKSMFRCHSCSHLRPSSHEPLCSGHAHSYCNLIPVRAPSQNHKCLIIALCFDTCTYSSVRLCQSGFSSSWKNRTIRSLVLWKWFILYI